MSVNFIFDASSIQCCQLTHSVFHYKHFYCPLSAPVIKLGSYHTRRALWNTKQWHLMLKEKTSDTTRKCCLVRRDRSTFSWIYVCDSRMTFLIWGHQLKWTRIVARQVVDCGPTRSCSRLLADIFMVWWWVMFLQEQQQQKENWWCGGSAGADVRMWSGVKEVDNC